MFRSDPSTGDYIEIGYDSLIKGVDHADRRRDPRPLYCARLDRSQVNGYAAVDYNSPATPHEEIARSIDVLHSTGTARFYPTVITGGPQNMDGFAA